MNQSLQYVITVLLVAILTVLVKLYAEHVEDRVKVRILWRWWVITYRGGKEPEGNDVDQ